MRLDANGGTQGAAAKPNDVPQEGQESAPDLARLQELWNTRQNGSQNNDYPIGPGDILTISVPDIEQLSQRRVRVSTHGTIELPLIGTIPTGGLSEDGLATEIDNKLQKYMYNPQATVFVDEYRNREVAVIGAVNHPGLVLLNSPDESLLDVLTQSGGLSGSASNEVILIPSRPGTVSMSQRLASVVSRPMPATGQTVNDVSDTATGGDEVPGAKVADAGASATSWNGSASSRYTDLAGSSSDAAPGAAGNDTSQVGEGSASSSDGPNGGSQTGNSASPAAGLGSASLSGHNDRQFAAGTPSEAQGAINPNHRLNRGVATASVGTQETAAEAMQLAGSGEAITINLKSTNLSDAGKYMNMPMRPGDVLIVPGGGDVMVVGWVQQPGRFQAGAGLTVLGAIGAAGGPMYAANTVDVALIRTSKDGSKSTIHVDMEKITHGDAQDIPVQANDVIDVPYSGWRIGPYIFYSVLTKMAIGGPAIPY